MATLGILLSDSSCYFQNPSVQKMALFILLEHDTRQSPFAFPEMVQICHKARGFRCAAAPIIYEASWNTVAGDYAVLHVDIIR